MAQLYCQVTANAVTQGPIPLPTSYLNLTGFDKVADPTIYGWYPYSDPGAPTYDGNTQTLTRSFTINSVAKTVTQAYAVSALPLDQIQNNQQGIIQQSHTAKLKRLAQDAADRFDTQSAVNYLIQSQRTFP